MLFVTSTFQAIVSRPRTSYCPTCGGTHNVVCLPKIRACFRCHQMGHWIEDYP